MRGQIKTGSIFRAKRVRTQNDTIFLSDVPAYSVIEERRLPKIDCETKCIIILQSKIKITPQSIPPYNIFDVCMKKRA